MNLDDIAKRQQELGEEILSNHTNWKKDAGGKKTPEYLEKRRSTIDQLLKRGEQEHKLAESMRDEDHSYFKSNFIEQIRAAGSETLKYLEECEKRLLTTLQPRQVMATRKTSTTDETKQEMAQKRRIELQMRRINKLVERMKSTETKIAEPYDHNLNYMKENLEEDWEEIRRENTQIWMQDFEYKDEYFTQDIFSTTQDQMRRLKQKIMALMEGGAKRTHQERKTIKIPEIHIPVFTGRYEEWITFHDIYKNIIHSNQDLSKSEKMQYLKTKIKGEPSTLIQHLDISDSNYESAWKILQERYTNKRLLFQKLMNKILALPSSDYESSKRIKDLHDTTEEETSE